MQISFPDKLKPLLDCKKRYITIYGGRGSGKSTGVALMLLIKATQSPLKVLCARSTLLSISQSVHSLLKSCIKMLGLDSFFTIYENRILGANGSAFHFSGLTNAASLKSYDSFNTCWVEEADQVSKDQWEILLPTIRAEGSQVIVVFNPGASTDDTYRRFVSENYYKDDSLVVCLNYTDNPFCPETIRQEAALMQARDYQLYEHIYLGKTKALADTAIFRNVISQAFIPDDSFDGPYYGCDLGLGGADAWALNKVYIKEDILYVAEEAYSNTVSVPSIGEFLDRVSGTREHVIRVDSHAPVIISEIKRAGFNRAIAVSKPAGSVEASLYHLKSYHAIVCNPSCKETLRELREAKWKLNGAGDILNSVNPACDDHAISALRYAIMPVVLGKVKADQDKRAAERAQELRNQNKPIDPFNNNRRSSGFCG